jgi:acetolactate synthase-like protein
MGGIERYNDWHEALQVREDAREADIDKQAAIPGTKGINPVQLFRELDPMLDNNSVLVADGGDFVGTASYTLKPRRPLSWLDPGAFGTLGVGGGFALGAKLVRPDAEVWIIWGDGSSAYSLAEFDTYARLGIPVIGLIGNDAAWAQIARDQVELLGDDVASQLAYSDYHLVAKGYGGDGVKVDNIEDFKAAVKKAKESVKAGKPFVINAILGKSDFRKGSISV